MKYPKIGIVGKPFIGNMDYDWNDYTVISGKINNLVSQNNCIPIGITNVTTSENLNQEDSLDDYQLSDIEKIQIEEQISGLDGIILQGGIQTCAYEEYIAKYAMEKGIPIMGLCAGFNTIVRSAGGTIIKNDNDSHDKEPNRIAHTISIMKDSNLYSLIGEDTIGVNSVHWMIAKEEGIPQDKLKITAKSPDGLVEAVEGKNIYGYKFHPEVMASKDSEIYNEKMVNIFTDFFGKCREYQHSRNREETDNQQTIEKLRKEVENQNEQIHNLRVQNLELKSRFIKIKEFLKKRIFRIPILGKMMLKAMDDELGEKQLPLPESEKVH